MTNEELVLQIQQGTDKQASLEQLYKQNRGLIENIIKPYSGIEDPEDLRQEAYFGIVCAADLWKSEEEVKFSTYAAYWIKQKMHSYIDKCGSVLRVPASRRSMIRKMENITNSYKMRFNRKPSDLELRYALDGISQEQLDDLRKSAAALKVASTSAPIGGEEADGMTLEDTLPDNGDPYEDTIERIWQEQLRREAWAVVDLLEDKRARVIRGRYEKQLTLKQCAAMLGVTTERARALEQSALRELRKPKMTARLEPYLTDSGAYSFGLKGSGYVTFKRTHTSVQERAIIALEEHRRRVLK